MKFTQAQKNSLISELEAALKVMREMPVTMDCQSCKHYAAPMCNLACAAVPPEVAAIGCEAYIYDENSPPF